MRHPRPLLAARRAGWLALGWLALAALLYGALAVVAPARAQPVPLRLPDTTAAVGATFTVPVTTTAALGGRGLVAFALAVDFNGNVLAFDGAETDGTLAAAWSVSAGAAGTGAGRRLTVSAAGAAPLAGSGPLVRLRFRAVAPGGSALTFVPTESYFNEGTPAVTPDHGSVNVPAPPTLTVSPNTAVVLRGETQAFTASGAAGPYGWAVTDPAVATISASGVLTGVGVGTTRVVGTGAGGARDTTGPVEVRAFRLGLAATSGRVGDTLAVPLTTTDLNGLGVTAGEVVVTIPAGFDPAPPATAGTLLAGVQVFQGASAGRLTLTFATATPLVGAGVLARLRLVARAAGGGGVGVERGTFGEGLAAVAGPSVYLAVSAAPNVTVSPSAATLVAGETQAFTASGGAAPYAWSTSDPAVATVSAAGVLTAVGGGAVVVTARSADGGEGRSGTVTVHDARVTVGSRSAPPGGEVLVPVSITDLPPDRALLAVEVEFAFAAGVAEALGVATAGALLDGWSVQANPAPGRLTVAAAGAQGVHAPGVLFYLRLRATGPNGSGTTVSVADLLLNEGAPTALTTAGTLTVQPAPTLRVRLLLDGPRSGSAMTTALNAAGLLPLAHPYGVAPWAHAGPEAVAPGFFAAAPSVVDWVLLELRTGPAAATTAARRAALLHADGSVTDLDGASPVAFAAVPPGAYHVVARHRNHLAVMTAAAVSLSGSAPAVVDFAAGGAHGAGAQRAVAPGVFALWAGDGNGSGDVSAADRNAVWRPNNGLAGYRPADFNLSGDVSAADRNAHWRPNNGRASQVPN